MFPNIKKFLNLQIFYTGRILRLFDHLGIYLQAHIQAMPATLQNIIATIGVSLTNSASTEVELNIFL